MSRFAPSLLLLFLDAFPALPAQVAPENVTGTVNLAAAGFKSGYIKPDGKLYAAFHRQFYGLDSDLKPDDNDAYVKCLMIVAGGDGVISDKEMQWLIDRSIMTGLPDETIESYSKYKDSGEWKTDSLVATLTKAGGDSVKRVLLNDMVEMASQDGLGPAEKTRAETAATKMDVTKLEQTTVYFNVDMTLDIFKFKKEFFWEIPYTPSSPANNVQMYHKNVFIGNPDSDWPPGVGKMDMAATGSGPTKNSEAYTSGHVNQAGKLYAAMHRQVYGLDAELELDNNDAYVKALIDVAGADGVLSEREEQWLVDRAMITGVPLEIIQGYKDYIKSGAWKTDGAKELQKFVAAAGGQSVYRVMLHDAVEMCSQDGISAHEKARAEHMAQMLKLNKLEFNTVLHLVQDAVDLLKAKMEFFWETAYAPPQP